MKRGFDIFRWKFDYPSPKNRGAAAAAKNAHSVNNQIVNMQQTLELQDEDLLPYVRDGTFPIIVAFSGGKDSIAMVLCLLEQGIDRTRIHLHHHEADGGGPNLFDWPCTKKYCQAFADHLGLAIYFSYREGGIYREIFRKNEGRQDIWFQVEPGGEYHRIQSNKSAINTRLKFPAVSANLLTRWCSGTVKIDVLASVVAHHPRYQNRLVVLTGERREESNARKKYKEVEVYQANSRRRKVIHWRPILNWPEFAIWNIMARWGIQPHPAYMLGWSRCSCQLCIFSSPHIWATLASIAPAKVDAIQHIENQIEFTLYHGRSIRETVKAGRAFSGLDPFWIAQGSGEFTASIVAPNWVLPRGAFSKESAGSV
jgi:3'-phosphoadenosine 5'-phosphosulfate sulfotransferase (PAPS reductase)/FAD synthetase